MVPLLFFVVLLSPRSRAAAAASPSAPPSATVCFLVMSVCVCSCLCVCVCCLSIILRVSFSISFSLFFLLCALHSDFSPSTGRPVCLGGLCEVQGHPYCADAEMRQLHVFHTGSKAWAMQECQPDPIHGWPQLRRSHSCTLHATTVFMLGGTNGMNLMADNWKLDLKTHTWTQLPAAMWPTPALFHTAVLVNNSYLVTFGGVLADMSTR